MINGKTVGLIAATDLNGLIGYDGKLPWKNEADMKRFKSLTMGHTVIMGRKTYESLPENKLPGRTVHVISSNNKLAVRETDKVFYDLIEAVRMAPNNLVWIAGGASIYKAAIEFVILDFIDLTLLNGVCIATISDSISKRHEKSTYMPNISLYYRVNSEVEDKENNLIHIKYVLRNPERWGWDESGKKLI